MKTTLLTLSLMLFASAALATPGDVYDPETDTWGQPDKPTDPKPCNNGCDPEPEPPRPEPPVHEPDDSKDHGSSISTEDYYCMGFRDGRKEVWKIGEPGFPFDKSMGLHWCDPLKHPVGTMLWNWQAEARAAGAMK